MTNVTKQIANRGHNDRAALTSKFFAGGFRHGMPKKMQKAKRVLRHVAKVKEARLASKEVY